MPEKKTSPLQAAFWLTNQEKCYVLVICVLFFIGLATRYFYLKKRQPEVYTPEGIEQPEQHHE